MPRKLRNVIALSGAIAALSATAYAQTPSATSRPRIELVGDSTQADSSGYGRGFCANLTAAAGCINMAKGGASTKTYRGEGHWDRALASAPNYMLIQFGHNDEVSPQHTDREATLPQYRENLRNFVVEARAHGITPVLVTPITRRYYDSEGKIHSDLEDYASAMRDVAANLNVPLIDLHAQSVAYLDRVGEQAGMALGFYKKDNGANVPDKTHLNWEGSYVFGRIVAVDLAKAVPALAEYVRPEPAELPAEGRLGMRVLHQDQFKIVLVGDSTVATEGGWGPGFCAAVTPNVTCIDDALNGRSTKSYIDEGAWQKALSEHGQYYFIQFGHNDQKPEAARHTDPDTTYAANLGRFINDVRAAGAIPILVTPLSRRNYRDGKLIIDDGLSDYAAAVRQVATEEHVSLLDLYRLSTKYLSALTQQQADAFDMTGHADAKAEGATAAKPDRTHLNSAGKTLFGRMVADEVIRIQPELVPNITVQPATPQRLPL